MNKDKCNYQLSCEHKTAKLRVSSCWPLSTVEWIQEFEVFPKDHLFLPARCRILVIVCGISMSFLQKLRNKQMIPWPNDPLTSLHLPLLPSSLYYLGLRGASSLAPSDCRNAQVCRPLTKHQHSLISIPLSKKQMKYHTCLLRSRIFFSISDEFLRNESIAMTASARSLHIYRTIHMYSPIHSVVLFRKVKLNLLSSAHSSAAEVGQTSSFISDYPHLIQRQLKS